MKHIVLLGDSIFDNGSYVGYNELDVPNQLKSLVKNDCRVTNLAVDGHVTSHIVTQLNNLPSDATHLFVSVGGNDALGHLSIFNETSLPAISLLTRVIALLDPDPPPLCLVTELTIFSLNDI